VSSSEAFIGRAVHCPHCQAVFEVPRFSRRRSGRRIDMSGRQFEFECPKCNQTVTATTQWVGQAVNCPKCGGRMHVPMPQDAWAGATVSGPAPGGPVPAAPGGGEFFLFSCHACRRYVTARRRHAGMVSRCPFCQVDLCIPEPGRGATPPPPTGAKRPMQLVGSPDVIDARDGGQQLRCPRCGTLQPVDAELCSRCGLAFTAEGVATRFANRTSGLAVTSMVIGIVMGMLSLMAWGARGSGAALNMVLIAPALVGLIMGIIALIQCAGRGSLIRGRGMAVAGVALIAISSLIVVGTGVYKLM
jgi:DNA-directed RNA polymerase subunit RPC12/RpoP